MPETLKTARMSARCQSPTLTAAEFVRLRRFVVVIVVADVSHQWLHVKILIPVHQITAYRSEICSCFVLPQFTLT